MSSHDWKTDGALWEKLQPFAQQMRQTPTDAENTLWQQLRNRSLAGWRFRRQHTIARFIADFYCADARLVIEVDGPIHETQRLADSARDEFLQMLDLRVLRFTNEQVLTHLDHVLLQIKSALPPTTPSTHKQK